MALRLSTPGSWEGLLEAKLGADGVQELHEIVIHAAMPQNLRKMVALTTQYLDERIGTDVAQELRE